MAHENTRKITYTDAQVRDYCRRFDIGDDRKSTSFHFPSNSFLEAGYAPPGGYVKDFSIIYSGGRYHLFHIDGRPQEKCYETGNEVSFGHASTENFRHWIRHKMPLAVGDRKWECEHVWAPYVCSIGDKYYMFYMGSGPEGARISYAMSTDLEKWDKWWDGPIEGVEGRDPFVYQDGNYVYMLYTGHGGARVGAVRSKDLVKWEELEDRLVVPERKAAESASMHPVKDKYVIWWNDYTNTNDASGDFRSCYSISDSPDSFPSDGHKVFSFVTILPPCYREDDWTEKRPTPIGIELVKKISEEVWLVAYFRWHVDRFRLFFGKLDWSIDPACITEINFVGQLEQVMEM